ncbi:MAG: type II toxin-antitoxin system HicA family toxin [Lachnospiraceae bacterium]|nr:type II toxin-antitoxin system HicA family toxin [Lachnospiraceae bacterium]
MSQIEKLKSKLLSRPKDMTYTEIKKLLNSLDFAEYNKGKTSGSRVAFYRESDNLTIRIHKPHPGDIVKLYVVDQLIEYLTNIGEL